ncbi:MAG: HEPN domain-containing protein [Defluviitaleaceae bacterium]|nr:HEPN domain-containing protein [Defluviitaleaceae bacterium]
MTDSLDVNEWIRYAQMDYDAAKNMALLFNPVPLEIVCYHCQQGAEKILKAYAIAKNEPLVKTHNLKVIIEQCLKHDETFNLLAKNCLSLNGYSVISRYPIGEDAVTEQDMNIALKHASEVMGFTKEKLNRLGYK